MGWVTPGDSVFQYPSALHRGVHKPCLTPSGGPQQTMSHSKGPGQLQLFYSEHSPWSGRKEALCLGKSCAAVSRHANDQKEMNSA